MAWITPKTNWTTSNYYNYSDVNRVENNTDAVADLVETYSARPILDIVKKDWTNADIVFYDAINRIESNILALKNATYQPLDWIVPITNWVSADVFDYVDANRLEANLLALYVMINNIIAEFEYCGSIICGQEFNLGM